MTVLVKNNIYCCVKDKQLEKRIKSILKYDYSYFRQGKYGKIREPRLGYFIKSGLFLCGFLGKIKQKLDIEVEGSFDYLKRPEQSFKLKGIKALREDQKEAVIKICNSQRGVILHATGTGKTVIAAAAIAEFYNSDYKFLFLAHSTDIVNQTYTRFLEYGFDCGILHGKKKKNLQAKVLVATIQSYSKYITEDNFDYNALFIDECHHANSLKSIYGKLLGAVDVYFRIGFTGTLPNRAEQKLALEGLIGPVISNMSVKEAVSKKILSRGKVTLFIVKKSKRLRDVYRYKELYDKGIVNNKKRNTRIIKASQVRNKKNKSVLIIVKEIKHGQNLVKIAKAYDHEAIFLRGSTDSSTREEVRQKLIKKEVLCVITTNIWNEGIDIPTLDVVINACGGKAETKTLQAIGRGLRITESKRKMEVIDFLDPYRFLAEHTIERMQIYKKEKML